MQRSLARRDATLLVIALLFALQAAIRFSSHVSHDVAWYIYAAGRLLDGAVLYRDLVEVNPPLGIWLTVPLVALARLTNMPAIPLFQAGVLALTVLSLGLAARLLTSAHEVSAGVRHALLILAAALMLFIPAYDFGQREHLVVLLVAPWLLLRWDRLLGGRVPQGLAVAIGLLAAMGFWLKPHGLLAAAAVEVMVLVVSRRLRLTFSVENLAAIAFSTVYVASIWIFAGDFFKRIIGLGMTAYVPFYGFDAMEVARRAMLPILLGVVAIAGGDLLGPQLRLLRGLLVAAGAGFLLAFVIQAGFRYQLIPALFFMALAVSVSIARLAAGGLRVASPRQRIVITGSAIGLVTVFAGAGSIQSPNYLGEPFERSIAAEAPDARSVFIASTSVFHGFPMVAERGFTWASRFPAQWLAPYVAATLDADGAPTDEIGRYAREATVGDLIDFEPDILFITESARQLYYKGQPLDYVAFWGGDPRFPQVWSAYEKRGLVGGFRVYLRRR